MNAQTPQMQIFQSQQKKDETHLKDYWAMFKRRWWLVFLGFVVAVGLTAVYLVRTPRQYEATAVVKILASSTGGGLAAALGAFLPVGMTSDVATEIEMIKGRNIAEKVITDLKLDRNEKKLEQNWRQIVSGFRKKLKVQQRGRTNLIEITATTGFPEEAKNIANAVAGEYIHLSKDSNQKLWDGLINQMEAKLEQTRVELERSRQMLHDYEAQEGITTAFSPLLIGAGTPTGKYGTQYLVSEGPQAIAKLKASIMEMEVQLETLRKSLPEANPKVINLKNQIVVSKQKLHQEEKEAIEKYNTQFGLTGVAAEVVFAQQLYGMLVAKQEELKAQYIMQNESSEVIEEAMEPLYPSEPKKKLMLMFGAVLGVFLGLGTALIWEFLDNSMHTPEDVAKSIDLSVPGSIPYLKEIKKNPRRTALITYYDASSSQNQRAREFYKESYRMLQLEVMAATNGKVEHVASVHHQGGLTLLVTSSVSEEGKSVVAANLAISIAQTGRKVLLVDADCRNPSQHKLLDLDNHIGLVDILAENANWSDVIKSTSINNLNAITYGSEVPQPDPSPLLISSHLEDFIRLSKEQFDVTIFDSPSVMLASESAAIGSKIDGVMLVIKANGTRKNTILQAKQRIQNSGGSILGAVLNCAAVKKSY